MLRPPYPGSLQLTVRASCAADGLDTVTCHQTTSEKLTLQDGICASPLCGKDTVLYGYVYCEGCANEPSLNDFLMPSWEVYEKVHCWRNYISKDLQEVWQTFTQVQKYLISESAQDSADKEEWN